MSSRNSPVSRFGASPQTPSSCSAHFKIAFASLTRLSISASLMSTLARRATFLASSVSIRDHLALQGGFPPATFVGVKGAHQCPFLEPPSPRLRRTSPSDATENLNSAAFFRFENRNLETYDFQIAN